MWMFWAFICLALGQLTHSWPANDQRFRLRAVLGRAGAIGESWPSYSQILRSLGNNNEDNDILNFLRYFERRGPTNNFAQVAFDRINTARKVNRTCGETFYAAAAGLEWNDKLGVAAQKHSQSMVDHDYFEHTGIDGSSPEDRIEREKYSTDCFNGENIAGGTDPEDTVNRWLKSEGHCANIMNPDSKAIGIGYAEVGTYGGYSTLNFGTC
ncbi:unnamed protein product [Rotaria sordida]|nr:unnamed protein product [Rotaria sordida]CAF1028625.1 unnamed protein product [Rotaria sordida]CAF3796441.1 unnamed protein product [Rotaria sordida]